MMVVINISELGQAIKWKHESIEDVTFLSDCDNNEVWWMVF